MTDGLGERLLTATEKAWRVSVGMENDICLRPQCGYSFLKSTKDVFNVHGAVHSPDTLHAIVHGQALRVII